MRTILYTLLLGNDSIEVDVEIEYNAHYRPGCLSGPPEYCCPDESEFETTGYKVLAIRPELASVSAVEIEAALEAESEKIEELCWGQYNNEADDYDPND